MEWTFNPWRERPGTAALATVAVLGMCLMIVRLGGPPVLVAALNLAAIGALSSLIAPARCRMDDTGVARLTPLGWRRRSWGEIRRAALAPGGLLLSPYVRAHWLDTTRGVFLPLPPRVHEALLAGIRTRLARHGL